MTFSLKVWCSSSCTLSTSCIWLALNSGTGILLLGIDRGLLVNCLSNEWNDLLASAIDTKLVFNCESSVRELSINGLILFNCESSVRELSINGLILFNCESSVRELSINGLILFNCESSVRELSAESFSASLKLGWSGIILDMFVECKLSINCDSNNWNAFLTSSADTKLVFDLGWSGIILDAVVPPDIDDLLEFSLVSTYNIDLCWWMWFLFKSIPRTNRCRGILKLNSFSISFIYRHKI